MTELLPCPFCGGEATVERIGKSGYLYVACNTAYCCDFGKFNTEAEAIAAWNTRAAFEMDGFFYLPKPKQEIGFTSETMVQRTEHGYQMGAIAYVYDNALNEWKKQLNDYIIGRICDVFRTERTCKNTDDEFPYFQCSECGCNAVVGYGSSGDGLPNYCPNCGAKVVER